MPRFVRDAGQSNTGLTPEQATQLTNAQTTLLQENRDIPPNWSGDLSLGTAVDVSDSVRVGLIAGGGISNSFRTRSARQQTAISADGQAKLTSPRRCFELITSYAPP